MANGKFITRKDANTLISERKTVDFTIRPIVQKEPETPPMEDQIKKAKRLVGNPTEGYVFDFSLVKALIEKFGDANPKYFLVMAGMDDPRPTVILGVANNLNDAEGREELNILGEEPSMLQHPRGIKVSSISGQKGLESGDVLKLILERDEEVE